MTPCRASRKRLLNLLQMNASYVYCRGAELHTSDGRRILDFLSGYCVHNIGHNHPHVVAELQSQLGRCAPAMLQSHVPELAGELAASIAKAGRAAKAAVRRASGNRPQAPVIPGDDLIPELSSRR